MILYSAWNPLINYQKLDEYARPSPELVSTISVYYRHKTEDSIWIRTLTNDESYGFYILKRKRVSFSLPISTLIQAYSENTMWGDSFPAVFILLSTETYPYANKSIKLVVI